MSPRSRRPRGLLSLLPTTALTLTGLVAGLGVVGVPTAQAQVVAATAPASATSATAPAAATQPAARKVAKRGFGFRLATFNVLGSQHTRGRGGYGPGTVRAAMTAAAIRRKNIDIIGMQEVQVDQHAVLRKRLTGHRIWPGTSLGRQGIRLQIAWRTDTFKLMKTGTIMTRFDRQTRPIPWVKLKQRDTGRRIYVVTIHNSPRGMEAERDAATRAELRLINRLRAKGNPVFVTGDMNEKEEFYCKATGRTDLKAANGGRADARRCSPPKRRLRIDWIMGGGRLGFSDYREDNGRKVRRISDHEFIHAKVRVRPLVTHRAGRAG